MHTTETPLVGVGSPLDEGQESSKELATNSDMMVNFLWGKKQQL